MGMVILITNNYIVDPTAPDALSTTEAKTKIPG
jgi:hypothetical protein